MTSNQQVAIVTGSAQGIGYAIVQELLGNGYRVCLTDINEEKGILAVQNLRREFGEENVIFLYCDVRQKSHFIDVFDNVLKIFKRIDLLVNNAGTVNELDPRQTLEINVMGPINGCEVAFKYMGKDQGGNGGIVINMASIGGITVSEIAPIYVASKHAVVGLTGSYGLGFHYERSGIIFCAVCPALVNTPLLQNFKTLSLMPGLDFTQRDDLMEASYIAKGVTKLLEDKKNGAILLILQEKLGGYKYVPLRNIEEFIDL